MSRVGNVENIERYLRAHVQTHTKHRTTDQSDGSPRSFVTISRQAGTGAHDLAEVMVDVFSQHDHDALHEWQIYDRTVCEIVAKDPAFAGSLESLVAEEYRSKAGDFFHQILASTADQGMVMERVFLVVRAVAGMGKSIIVGRGGSYVTKDMARGVSIRLVAPNEQRLAKIVKSRLLDERDARSDIRRRDADRERMIRAHFGVDIEDPLGYDATWNVGSSSYEEIAESIAGLVLSRTRTS